MAALLLLAAPSLAAVTPSTQPAEETIAAKVDRLVDELEDADPQVRRRADLQLKNLSGDALEPVEAALKREELGPEVKGVLRTAASRLRVRARHLREFQQQQEWNRKTSLEQYNRIGKKGPRWDDLVAKGAELFMRADVPARVEAHGLFQKAVEAGCDDPLVLYLEARTLADVPGRDQATVVQHYQRAATAVAASGYDATHKVLALIRCYQVAPQTPVCNVDEMLKLALESARDQNVPRSMAAGAFMEMMPALTRNIGREQAFKRIYPRFEATFRNSPWLLLFKGDFYIDWAWDARGNGFANTVTPQGWRLFGERLNEAEQALEQAWKIDPTNGQVAASMIRVELGKADGRERMEEWFKRAMEADPDNYAACNNKLWYLAPRWYGSNEERLKFGHECAAGDNYFAVIPFILLEAHSQIVQESRDPQYLKRPDVWADISKLYENLLVLYPTEMNRSRYAQWAFRCGHPEIAHRQFVILGDHPDPVVFPDKGEYDTLRAEAKKAAEGK